MRRYRAEKNENYLRIHAEGKSRRWFDPSPMGAIYRAKSLLSGRRSRALKRRRNREEG